MLEIIIDDKDFLAGAEIGLLETDIYNDARSNPSPSGRWGGYPYFWAVDQGRGPVRPIYAKALRIPLADGTAIFRKSAGPSTPRNIVSQSLAQLEGSAINAALSASGSTLRGWFAMFLNKIAFFHAEVLEEVTPHKSGKLAGSYRTTTTV